LNGDGIWALKCNYAEREAENSWCLSNVISFDRTSRDPRPASRQGH